VVIDRFFFFFSTVYNVNAPQGAKSGVLPQLQTSLISSSATHLSIGVSYPFFLNSSFEILHGSAVLTAVYAQQSIGAVSVSNTRLLAGSNTLSATVTVRADSPAQRAALETFASAAFQGDAAPLALSALVSAPWFRFAPVAFSYDFVLPKQAAGGGSGSSVLPCIDVGLTTPFDSSWSFGRCLVGCSCTGTSRLCRTGPTCDSVSVLSRCVNMAMSIISHFYVNNVLPLTLQMQVSKQKCLSKKKN
jgi:hypothetical protein